MSASLLVSASKGVKIWDLKSITGDKNSNEIETSKAIIPEQLLGVEVSSFAPDDASTGVSVVRWSHDNQLLAVVGNEGTLTIHDSQGKFIETIPSNNYVSDDYTKINSLRFSDKSQYVLFGGSDKIVNIWDRKGSTFIEPLEGHSSAITCIDLNLDESIVASSALNGNIIIHNRQKSNSRNNLAVSTKQPINVLQYSYVKRGLLAAGGEDGSLRLWDTSGSTTAIQTYEKAHHSEIKGIAFSPSNSHLLLSAGMDRRIVMYDVGKKEADCVTIAVGTLQGKILIYDLRSLNKVMCTLNGYESRPIQCLHFQEKSRTSMRRATLSKNKNSHIRTSSRGTATLPISSSNKSAKGVAAKSSSPVLSESKGKNYMDMFSPVKKVVKDDITIDDTVASNTENNIDNNKNHNGAADENVNTRNIIDKNRIHVNHSVAANENVHIKTIIDDKIHVNHSRAADENVITKNIIDDKIHSRTTEENVITKNIDDKIHAKHGGAAEENINTKNMINDKDHMNHNRVADENVTIKNNIDDNHSRAVEENVNTISTATNFQLQVIGSVVDECLQDFRISLRNDIQNMHLELLRQFHIQKVSGFMDNYIIEYINRLNTNSYSQFIDGN
ncbi:13691_t:CDS:2 [Funneliformis geosporum]|uniref:2469_t:CDS:1 n=1 Tax=Funneliformis geosporum TaxID=1117311 RepID=A0A9W4SI89_9GLOM|nr:2469_t:CDS:2 [Funneliformis geosporum]CAI2168168.1 13691_t:CDS:2 [Funneliformis geosporum]